MSNVNLTDPAQRLLEKCFEVYSTQWEADGADVEEVKLDVYSHIHAKYGSVEVVTDGELQALLEGMGFTLDGLELNLESPTKSLKRIEPSPSFFRRFFGGYWRMMTQHWFGVLAWPILIILIEFLSNFCGGIWFSPVSRWQQAALILVVAAGGLVHYRRIQQEADLPWWDGVIRGVGVVVAGYWSLLLIPVLVMGTFGYGMGVVWTIGIGLIAFPIYLVCASVASAPIFLFAGFVRNRGKKSVKNSALLGCFIGLALLFIVEGPFYLTRIAAANDNAALIRKLGSSEMLVQMEYESRWGYGVNLDTTGYVISSFGGDVLGMSSRNREHEDIAQLYYQVTGETLDGANYRGRQLRGSGRDGDAFDENIGGDGVMQRVPDLAMSSARYDAHVDAKSNLVYWESTFVFKNSGSRQKEARMQLLLPPNGVVTRLTLWVNGEPREAAFAATSKVKAAYQDVAVEQRRDPVLVRWVGPDRVMVQCFPVPASGEMKIRLGVTSKPDSENRVFVPRVIERNFDVPNDLQASLWVQGNTDLSMHGLEMSSAEGKWRETHGEVSMTDLMDKHAHVKVNLEAIPDKVWTIDRFKKGDQNVLVGTQSKSSKKEVQSVVVIIDGSSGVASWKEDIAEVIDSLNASGKLIRVIVANQEQVVELIEGDALRELDFVGGQNNLPALLDGYDIAVSEKADTLVWIHGDQPIRFDGEAAFTQRVEHGFHKPNIVTVDLTGGPNRVLEQLGKEMKIYAQLRPSNPEELDGEIEDLMQGESSVMLWKYVAEGEQPTDGVKVWDQLVRWKVWREVEDQESSEELVKRAALYQLVTPVSGAVVLETQEQYDKHGLVPIGSETAPHVPSIPEPQCFFLLMIGSFIIFVRRNRD